ncbi:MAG TPA: IclR family transcriptional regulator [Bryobacteraceae bacterium]|nr:IclR family transcriptional regulator [Bryobacteraceae bacterium]
MVKTSAAHSVSVERVMAILELLSASAHGKSLSQISQRLTIPRSTAHVLIVTLLRLGYVRQSAGGHLYSLGAKAQMLAAGPVACMDLGNKARPHLASLTEITGLTSYVAVLDRDQALYVECCRQAEHQIDVFPGKRANLHCTAVGNVLLAGLRRETLEEFLGHHALMRHTSKTVRTADELRARLERVRKQGFAMDDEEQALGIRCLAVPIYDVLHRITGALGITGMVSQIRDENLCFLVECLKKASEPFEVGGVAV